MPKRAGTLLIIAIESTSLNGRAPAARTKNVSSTKNRPHLTKWQARYRNWRRHLHEALTGGTPPEQQKDSSDEVMGEMLGVKKLRIEYATQLVEIVKEHEKA